MANQVNSTTNNSSNWKQNIIGLTSATTGGALAFYGGKKLIGIPIKNMQKNLISDAVSSNSIFKNSAIKVLNDNKIKYANLTSPIDFIFDDDVLKFMGEKNKSPFTKIENKIKEIKNKILPKFITKMKDKNILKKMDSYASGTNACCLGDKVFVNFDKISVAAFHEAGHAKNYTSKFGKLLQNLRSPMLSKILLGVAFASALLPKKTEEEQKELEKNGNFIEKGLNFSKENCLGFALAGTLPQVLEEGLATYKGNKMAKTVLNNENLKKLKTFNRKALLTYGAKATLILGTVFITSKIKDCFTNKKQEEIS